MRIRSLIAALILGMMTSFSFSGTSHAINNKDLMEYCLTVEQTNFDFTRTRNSQEEWNFMFCTGYMIGVTHTFYYNCEESNTPSLWQESSQTRVFRDMYAASTSDPDAATQAFMNWARQNPDMWDKDATGSLWKWLPKTFPCQ